jgi:hypothetical protein
VHHFDAEIGYSVGKKSTSISTGMSDQTNMEEEKTLANHKSHKIFWSWTLHPPVPSQPFIYLVKNMKKTEVVQT